MNYTTTLFGPYLPLLYFLNLVVLIIINTFIQYLIAIQVCCVILIGAYEMNNSAANTGYQSIVHNDTLWRHSGLDPESRVFCVKGIHFI